MWTTLTSVTVLVGAAALSYFLARRGAVDVYGPYQLAKRVGTSIMPFLVLGLNVAAVKYIPSTKDRRGTRAVLDGHHERDHADSACRDGVSDRGSGFDSSIVPRCGRHCSCMGDVVVSVALTMNTLVYTFYRAEMRQDRANWSTLSAMTIAPVVVVALAPQSWKAVSLLLSVSLFVIVWNGSQLVWRLLKALGHTRPMSELALK